MNVYRRLSSDHHQLIGTTTDEQGAGFPVRDIPGFPRVPEAVEFIPRRGIVLEVGEDPAVLPGWKPKAQS